MDRYGRPTQAFMIWWQRVCEELETQINTINGQLNTLINTAQSTANTGVTNAATADTKAVAALRQASRVNSYPNPGSIVTASDAGTSATITIANHTRVYPIQGTYKVPDVSITGSSITGLAYNTFYYIYYDDTTLAVTAPTFVATTSAPVAQVGYADGRHFVGFVTTPVAGGGTTSGSGGATPGGGGGGGGGHQGGYIP